jgi:hypothetical protein
MRKNVDVVKLSLGGVAPSHAKIGPSFRVLHGPCLSSSCHVILYDAGTKWKNSEVTSSLTWKRKLHKFHTLLTWFALPWSYNYYLDCAYVAHAARKSNDTENEDLHGWSFASNIGPIWTIPLFPPSCHWIHVLAHAVSPQPVFSRFSTPSM